MSKRRNAKKEKAARNKINARKFRKLTTRHYGKGKRYSNYNSNSENKEQKTSETQQKQSSSPEQNVSKERI